VLRFATLFTVIIGSISAKQVESSLEAMAKFVGPIGCKSSSLQRRRFAPEIVTTAEPTTRLRKTRTAIF
jgi:hypothetical protein